MSRMALAIICLATTMFVLIMIKIFSMWHHHQKELEDFLGLINSEPETSMFNKAESQLKSHNFPDYKGY